MTLKNSACSKEWRVGQRCLCRLQDKFVAGRIRFVGTTHFKPGLWYGIQLDEPHGKHDGVVADKRYFGCKPFFGIFLRRTSLSKLPKGNRKALKQGIENDSRCVNITHEELEQKLSMLRSNLSSSKHNFENSLRSSSPSPLSSTKQKNEDGSIDMSSSSCRSSSKQRIETSASLHPRFLRGAPFDSPVNPKYTTAIEFEVGTVVCVKLRSSESVLGTVRFAGLVPFARGVWYGIDLATPAGLNDGSVQGDRYFTCEPKHGVFVRAAALCLSSERRTSIFDDSSSEHRESEENTSFTIIGSPDSITMTEFKEEDIFLPPSRPVSPPPSLPAARLNPVSHPGLSRNIFTPQKLEGTAAKCAITPESQFSRSCFRVENTPLERQLKYATLATPLVSSPAEGDNLDIIDYGGPGRVDTIPSTNLSFDFQETVLEDSTLQEKYLDGEDFSSLKDSTSQEKDFSGENFLSIDNSTFQEKYVVCSDSDGSEDLSKNFIKSSLRKRTPSPNHTLLNTSMDDVLQKLDKTPSQIHSHNSMQEVLQKLDEKPERIENVKTKSHDIFSSGYGKVSPHRLHSTDLHPTIQKALSAQRERMRQENKASVSRQVKIAKEELESDIASRIRTAVKQERERHQGQLKTLKQRAFEQLQKSLELVILDAEKHNNIELKKRDDLWNERISKLTEKISFFEEKEKQYSEIDSVKELSKARIELKDLRNRLLSSDKELEQLNETKYTLQQAVKDRNRFKQSLEAVQTENVDLKAKLTISVKKNRTLTTLEIENDELKKKVKSLEVEINQRRERESLQAIEVNSLQELVAKEIEKASTLEIDLTKMKKDNSENLERLKKSQKVDIERAVANATTELSSKHSVEVKRLKGELMKLKTKSKEEENQVLQALAEEHKVEMETLKSEMFKELEEAMQALVSDHEVDMKILQSSLSEREEELEKKDNLLKKTRKSMKEKNKNVDNMKKELDQKINALKKAHTSIRELRNELGMKKELMKKSRQEVEELRKTLKNRDAAERAKKLLSSSEAKKRKRITEVHDAEINKLIAKHENDMTRCRTECDDKISKLKEKNQCREREFRRDIIAEYDDKITKLKAKYEKEYGEKLEEIRKEESNQLSNLKNAVVSEYNDKITALEAKHKKAYEEKVKDLNAKNKNQILQYKTQIKTLEIQRDQNNSEDDDEITHLKGEIKKLEILLKAKDTEYEHEIVAAAALDADRESMIAETVAKETKNRNEMIENIRLKAITEQENALREHTEKHLVERNEMRNEMDEYALKVTRLKEELSSFNGAEEIRLKESSSEMTKFEHEKMKFECVKSDLLREIEESKESSSLVKIELEREKNDLLRQIEELKESSSAMKIELEREKSDFLLKVEELKETSSAEKIDLESEKSDLLCQIGELNESSERAYNEMEHMAKEINLLKSEKSDLLCQIGELNESSERSCNEMERMAKEINLLKEGKEKLEMEHSKGERDDAAMRLTEAEHLAEIEKLHSEMKDEKEKSEENSFVIEKLRKQISLERDLAIQECEEKHKNELHKLETVMKENAEYIAGSIQHHEEAAEVAVQECEVLREKYEQLQIRTKKAEDDSSSAIQEAEAVRLSLQKQKDRCSRYKDKVASLQQLLRAETDKVVAFQGQILELQLKTSNSDSTDKVSSSKADNSTSKATDEQFQESLTQYKNYLLQQQESAAVHMEALIEAGEIEFSKFADRNPKAAAKLEDKLKKLRSHKEIKNTANIEKLMEHATNNHKKIKEQQAAGEADLARWLDVAAEEFLGKLAKKRKKCEATRAKLLKKIEDAS
eukprot:g4714.t1